MSLAALLELLPKHEAERLNAAGAIQRTLLADYRAAHQEISSELAARARDDLTPTQLLQLVQSAETTRFISNRVEQLNARTARLMRATANPISKLVARQIEKERKLLGLPAPAPPDPNLLEVRLAQAVARIQHWNGLLPQDILKALRIGLLKGEGYSDLANRIASGKPGPTGASPGRKNQAHMLTNVRYAVVDAANEGREDAYKSIANQGVPLRKMWWASIETCCVNCAQLHGQVVPVGEPFQHEDLHLTIKPYRSRLTHPPLHPNCKCRIIPILPEVERASDLDQILADRQHRLEALAA